MVSTLIDPRDEMYQYSVESLRGNEAAGRRLYFEKGRQIADAVLQIADRRRGGRESVSSFLDFASGYGRATRFLSEVWPPASITVCDIQADGVAFQREHFGFRGVVSTSEPERLSFDRRFDMIFAASFFSHVPPASFVPWLARLAAFLDHRGVLVLSTNTLTARPDVDLAEGCHFEPTSESSVLAGEAYGTTWVSDEFVRRVAASASPDARLHHLPRGLCGHQDLWVLDRCGHVGLAGFAGYPAGDVDLFEKSEGSVRIGGWARDWTPEGRVVQIVLDRAGRELESELARDAADGTTRWSFELPLSEVSLDELIGIVARNDQGRSNLVALGTLRPFLGE